MSGHFQRRFNNLKDLGQITRKMGISKAQEGKHAEALQWLNRCALDDEIKCIMLGCHYQLGKSCAAEDNWSEAQSHFKYLLKGERGRLVQERLRLISERMKNRSVPENLYQRAKTKGTLRCPTINKATYLPEIDDVICEGVYKWVGDPEAADEWSCLLRRIKKGNSEEAARATIIAGTALFECISHETKFREVVDVIVPVPTDPERRRERNFNIPTLIAQTVSKYSCIPSFEDILIKIRSTVKRSGTAELSPTLAVDEAGEIAAKNVLLIDDITTHGHTFKACGEKLKTAGARSVFAAALAHSEPTSVW